VLYQLNSNYVVYIVVPPVGLIILYLSLRCRKLFTALALSRNALGKWMPLAAGCAIFNLVDFGQTCKIKYAEAACVPRPTINRTA